MSKPGLIPPPPRLYAIVARTSPWAVVIRRGPSKWFHIFRWDLESGKLEDGVWFHGLVYPWRCDIDDDGRLFLFFMRATINGKNDVYAGVLCLLTQEAKTHWLVGTTWSGGFIFSDEARTPTEAKRMLIHVDGRPTLVEPTQKHFGNERHHGWWDSGVDPGAVPPTPDPWGQTANLIKRLPSATLHLTDVQYRRSPAYSVDYPDGRSDPLTDVVWADADHRSRLLTATSTGLLRIQTIESDGLSTVVEHDLRGMRPRLSPRIDWRQSTEIEHANYF
jgi:hypothetical protein